MWYGRRKDSCKDAGGAVFVSIAGREERSKDCENGVYHEHGERKRWKCGCGVN
jgi:hypothetical protein